MLKGLHRYWPTFSSRRQTLDAVAVADFRSAYGSLSSPMALCEGLDIICANAAFSREIFNWQEPVLISDLLPQRCNPAVLFERGQSEPPLQFEMSTNGGQSTVRMRVLPWPHGRSYALLECENISRVVQTEQALQIARSHDSATGLLLKGAFLRSVENALEILNPEQTALVALLHQPIGTGTNGPDDEVMSEQVAATLESIQREFGAQTLLGRHGIGTMGVFAVLPDDEASLRHALRRLQRVAQSGFRVPDIAIGAAIWKRGPNESQSTKATNDAKTVPADLLKKAELALGQAQTGERPTLFEPAMEAAANRLAELGEVLEQALSPNPVESPVETHFQPVINPHDGRIQSFESLVRWHHKTHGHIAPPTIIEMATEHGLLDRLTERVVDDALLQTKAWPDDIHFAVNVTPSQLTNGLVDMVRRKVRERDIDPSRLEIEITEEALIEDFDVSARIVDRLRAIGVGVAMDDFGAGYTSLSNLRHLSFTRVKIDKSISDGLPNDPRSAAIVRSIMYLARELDVDVTVEGIETADQLAFLKAFECGVQGYVFSKPLPPAHLPDLARFLTPNTWQCGQPPVVANASKVVGLTLGRGQRRAKALKGGGG